MGSMRLVSIFFLAVWVLVLLRVIANLLLVRRLNGRERKAGDSQPFVSIIIPALNEARAIERTLRAFLAQDYEPFEIILVDGGSTDGTAAIARSIADLRLVVIDSDEVVGILSAVDVLRGKSVKRKNTDAMAP